MTMFLAPYTAIADIDGSPLDAGFLFFGEYGKDPELFPVEVFWDADFTVPAAQPIRTRNGYPVRNGSPTKVYLKTAQHSIAIKNRNGAFILVDFFNKGWDASFVTYNGQTQQKINDGFSSIAEMLSIPSPKDGMRVFVKGLQGGWFEYNAAKSEINDGGTVFNGWVRYTLDTFIKPEWFGSPRNGVDDDAEGIRKAIAHIKTRGGGTLFFTKDDNKYQAKSVDSNNSAFTIDSNDVNLVFESDTTEIIAQIAMGSICYLNASLYNFTIKQGRFNANNKAEFALNTNPLYYTPLITIESTAFRNAIDTCLSLRTYVGTLTKVNAFGGKCGIRIQATSGGSIITSLTLTGCYALNFTEFGYDLSIACYCSLISCAADNSPNGIAYRLNMRGGAMIGCGAEHVKQPIQFVSFRGVSVQSFYCQRVGTTDPLNPQPYLIEFVTGTNATLSGLLVEAQEGYYYDKRVAITTSNYGAECLTVTDRSVTRRGVSFVTNYEINTRPIKLLIGDATQKDETVTISTVAELQDYIKTFLTEYRLDHTLTIQLANGVYNLGGVVSTLDKLYGAGEVIIQGNSSDRTLVKIETEYNRLVISRCSAKVRLKDLTLSANTSNSVNERLVVTNSPRVFLDNVLISRNGVNVGIGVRARNGSCVYLTNGTEADSSAFTSGIFVKDNTSEFILDASDTIPTTSNWSQGMKVENSNPTTHLGWVFSGGAWKTYGAIT